MSKKSQYGYKSKPTNWGKVFRKTVNDVTNGVLNYKNSRGPTQPNCPNPAARLCIFVLIGITLLFSGISIFAWIIILMLLIVLRFV